MVTGIVTGSGYYRYKAPRIAEARERELAAAPTTAEGRIARWHEFGAPQIHHRLTKVPPTIGGRTWLVTHMVLDPAGGEPEVWGIDTSDLPVEVSRIEGLTVVIDLPQPRLLGRAALSDEGVQHVPRYGAGDEVPDPVERLRYVATWFLGGLPGAISRDIEGARIEVRVAGTRPPSSDGEAGSGEPGSHSAPKPGPENGR